MNRDKTPARLWLKQVTSEQTWHSGIGKPLTVAGSASANWKLTFVNYDKITTF